MKIKLIHVLVLIGVLKIGSPAFAQLYTFKNFNHRDGLDMASTLSLNQSSDGNIWVGTDGAGLVRFDGKSFEEIRLKNMDNDHHVKNISFDGSDILFASVYKGFYKYSRNRDSLEKLNKKNLKFGDAIAVYKREDIYYLIGTRAIYKKTGNTFTSLFSLKSNQEAIIITQIIEAQNAIFILSNYGKFKLEKGELMPIHKWLNLPKQELSTKEFGYYDGEKIALFDRKANTWIEVVLNNRGGFYSINSGQKTSQIEDDESIIDCSYSGAVHKGGILTDKGTIYSIDNKSLHKIAHNFNESFDGVVAIFSDIYGDFWLASDMHGIYKVSKEPFTKIQLHTIYESTNISFPFRTSDGRIIISLFDNETYVGTMYDQKPFVKYDYTIKGAATIGKVTYLATNSGIRVFKEGSSEMNIAYFDNQNVTFILADGINLWVGLAGKGLFRINTVTEKIIDLTEGEIPLPQYYYTGQVGAKGKIVYFGTNNGIFQFVRSEQKLTRLDIALQELGSYSGVSTKDIYGTCWFTLEKGIVGVTKDRKQKIVRGEKYFSTNLFYTLNSDKYGNLIVGTNKGLTMLKVNPAAQIIDVRHFNSSSGFMGYETNMRSQFQNGNSIFVGTVEGLFLIDTEMLENLSTPLSPTITSETSVDTDRIGSFHFNFHVNNPKSGNVLYIYRLIGQSDHWIKLDEAVDHLEFHKLGNGDYTLEVMASFDGVHYSEAAKHSFSVNLPLWKSNWFVLIMMAAVILINVLLLNFYKSFDSGKLMNTKDIVVHLRMAPTILLFAAITAPTSQILGPIFSPELKPNVGQALIMGFLLLTMYFLSLTAKANNKAYLYDRYLKIALYIVTANYLWEVYISNLHPFNIIGVVLISTIVPYVLGKIKTTIIFSLVILSISVCYVSILDDTVYPKSYFLIAILVMSSLMIFASYLRYDSLEKLIFVSSIINKGNIPAIAFNKDGKVTYSSENISNFANITHDEIIGNSISILNNFIPFGEIYKEKDITKEFRDGEKYLVPLENTEGSIRWIEWAYKDFSNNIKVILGQDVTEKMELENTYELLVQNAEDFIYRCDIEGNFIFMNNICFTKLGYIKKEIIGSASLSIVPEEYKEEVNDFYEEHFASRRNSSYKEFPILKKSGEVIWIGQYVTTLYSAGSESSINGYIALARDITEIREQQGIIRDQRDAITSSINYARRIQYNLLPQESQFEKTFEEHFIFSKAKDIVSGDFYWMQKIQKTTVLVVADCTGHGVPGSFMTLLGFNLLNSIVLENGLVNPSNILNELDKKLKEYLPKGEGENTVNDGMEVTVCVFDDLKNELSYACAGSRFLVCEKGVFTMFKGDNKHIGDTEDSFIAYNTHYANFTSDFSLFLFTDGFQDQFGGSNDKKYSFRRLLELLESNMNLPLSEQRKMIEDSFDRWIGKNEQTDDVTIISVKRKFLEL